jgi:hypothetical protein
MSNDKQSSVEWLYNKMVIKLCNKLQTIEYTHIFLEEFEQAKAMHKEEIIESIEFADYGGESGIDAQQYYRYTFGGNNEQQ